MKILALVILILLLLHRIKTTPSNLSKKIWMERLEKSKDKLKQTEIPITDEMKNASLLIVLLMELFLIIFYAILGCSIGTTLFIILSALQITTCILTTKNCIKDFNHIFDSEANDNQFQRWFFLLNVILDYIYYPMAIYMLLK